MRKVILAVITAAPMLATLPVAAHADPYGRVPSIEHRDQFGMRYGEPFRHDGWERGRHFGWRSPWWFKRHHFEHDYGWYRGPYERRW